MWKVSSRLFPKKVINVNYEIINYNYEILLKYLETHLVYTFSRLYSLFINFRNEVVCQSSFNRQLLAVYWFHNCSFLLFVDIWCIGLDRFVILDFTVSTIISYLLKIENEIVKIFIDILIYPRNNCKIELSIGKWNRSEKKINLIGKYKLK